MNRSATRLQRFNGTQTWINAGLANRTALKEKPSALDMVLLFKEVVRVKRNANPGLSTRDLLNAAVQDYNKSLGGGSKAGSEVAHHCIVRLFGSRRIFGRSSTHCSKRQRSCSRP